MRKWYFCINERGFEPAMDQIRAAVMSARANTELKPHCVYSGSNPHHRNILTRLGVETIHHTPSFEDALRQGYGDQFETFNGHWLRVDLPLIEQEDDLVLYTDIDVMFLRHPEPDSLPSQLAAAPEFDRSNRRYFSSGVMVMNIPRLRELHAEFVDAIRARLTGRFSYPAHDQESFNRFFNASPMNRWRGRSFEPLPHRLNWKPFWGLTPDATIVHFHGPKPPNIRLIEKGIWNPTQKKFVDLWHRSPEAYDEYSTLWEGYDRDGKALLDSFL